MFANPQGICFVLLLSKRIETQKQKERHPLNPIMEMEKAGKTKKNSSLTNQGTAYKIRPPEWCEFDHLGSFRIRQSLFFLFLMFTNPQGI